MVTGPFVVLFLMIISRLTYFDRWDWPLSLVAIIGLNSLYAIVAAAILRRSAERTRSESLTTLREERIRCLAKGEDRAVRLLDRLIDEIKSLSQGVFAPISQQPVVRAFLVPFGGIGVAVFLDSSHDTVVRESYDATSSRQPFRIVTSHRYTDRLEGASPTRGMALCLSGGGYRAMVFHTGVLWRLYEANLLRDFKRISRCLEAR